MYKEQPYPEPRKPQEGPFTATYPVATLSQI
jgi:hypothetical protein